MFGGLSMKGETKEEPSPAPAAAAPVAVVPSAPAAVASTGFSFLQSSIGASPAPAPPAPPAESAAASEPQSRPDSSSSGLGISGSAIGFTSAGNVSGAEETTASTLAAAPPPAAPSMFAGLTTSSAKAPPSAPASVEVAAPPASGFSFLSAPSPAAPSPAFSPVATESPGDAGAVPTASTGGSSFSFMSGVAGSDHKGGGETETATGLSAVKENDEAAPPAAPGVSGFSFMSGAPAAAAPANAFEQPPEKKEESSISAGAGVRASGFSLLGAATSVAPASPPSEVASPAATQPPPLISESAKLDAIAGMGAARPAPAPVDLMFAASASLPAGSGVSWSAPPVGAAKKVVKKKRGKRVGVGSAAASSSGAAELPAPGSMPEQASSFRPPSVPGAGPVTPQPANFSAPSANSNPPMIPGTNAPANPVTPTRVRAERAMDKADEFIREKQRKSAIAMAAERAMHDRGMPRSNSSASGTSGGSDGWKMENDATGGEDGDEPGSPTDETYRAAKAAAAEARKLATGHAGRGKAKGKAKGSLFGNFFQRKSGSNSSNHGISSHSSHGGVVSPTPGKVFHRGGSNGSGAGVAHSPLPPTQEKVEIASYGDPRPIEEATPGGTPPAGDAALEEERRHQEWIQREERERCAAELREAAAAEAEIHRQKEERERRAREEEEEKLARRQEEERLRRRSPRDKMQSMLDHLADAARTSTDSVTILRARRAELLEERAQAKKAERYAEQRRAFAEARQAKAAEEEDFEAADRLAGTIEEHAREREEQSNVCKRIYEAIAKLDKEKEAAAKAVSACFNMAHTQLKGLEKEVDDHEKEEDVLDQFATTSKRLSSETERLANDLKHIERDEKVWKEESKELKDQIEEETKEFVEKRSEASTKLEEVNKAVEDLRKQLAEAELKASELTTEISTQNESIGKIKSKFSRQLVRLEKKEQSVKESRWDWESEKESIEKAQAAHEAVVAAHSEDMLSREKLIDAIKSESSVAKDFEEILSSAFAYVCSDRKVATSDLDSEVLKYEAAVNEVQQKVAAADANIKRLEEELSGIEVRVPILESEKKLAAGKRDFKAAGRASKEIKEALARKEGCAAQLAGEAMERQQTAKEELRKISATLEEKSTIAAERGRQAGSELMELLRAKIGELKSMQQRFATPDSEKFGTERWGEDEEDSITVACVGAFVIESQILVLEAEGKLLGEKYGGWDSPDGVVEDTSVQSAPTFDSADSEIVIDKCTLEKYISMRNEMKELEGAIEEAAKKEDYEKAAELEEQAATIREEFEAAGFMTEKFSKSLKDFTSKSSGAASEADSAKNGENSSKRAIDDSSVLEKYASFCEEIKLLEANIEDAVADDDFDKAAELEEKVQSARSEIESLGYSVDDLEVALKNSPDTATEISTGEKDKNLEDTGDDSFDGADGMKEENCGENLNGDHVKINGEPGQDETAAVNNTDGVENEDCENP